MLTYIQKFCIDRFVSKFEMKSFLNIPPHLKDVATLRYEILSSENCDSLKHVLRFIKSQGSVAAMGCSLTIVVYLTRWRSKTD